MEKCNTRGATHNYAAPSYWNAETDGECGILEVRVDAWGERKLPQCVSTWKPTAEELVQLLHGGVIELAIIGDQPPVMLTVVEPVHTVHVPDRIGTKTVAINEEGHGFCHDEHGVAQP